MAAPKLMTVDEYFTGTPETTTPMELAFGVLRVAERSPSIRHQRALGDFLVALSRHVEQHGLGTMWLPIDVVLDEEKALIVQPDLMFVSNDRKGILQDWIRGAPDLVIDILSPEPRIGDVNERVGWYRDYGVRECWWVYQDRRDITVIEFADRRIARQQVFGARELLRSAVVPDFRRALDDITQA
jgi:Uma2 family endonuclease